MMVMMAAHQRMIFLLLSLITACSIPGLRGVVEGRLHTTTLSGFPDLSDLQRDAAQLYDRTVLYKQVTLFPTVTFNCTGRVTSLILAARIPTDSLFMRNPQLQVWRKDDVNQTHRRVSPGVNITVEQLTEISPFVFTFSPDDMNFSDGDYLGLYQPSEGDRTIDVFLQEGGGPENVYIRETANHVDTIPFSESSSDLNVYPLISVQTDPPGCAKGFLTTQSLMRFVEAQLVESYEQEQRLIPGIKFNCNASLDKWTVAGQIGEGSSHPELQVWVPLPEAISFTRIRSFPLVGSELQPRPDQQNVYNFVPDEEVTISNGSVLGLFQPAFAESSFVVYYQSYSGPLNYGASNRNTSSTNLHANSDTQRGNYYPLVTVDVTLADCVTGFISADTLAEQALFLATFADVYSQQRIIPAMTITQDGLLTKWTFAARNLGAAIERTEYPELQILRLNSGDMYDIVHKTNSSEQPSRTGFLNVYEYIPNLPLRVRAGDILGFIQPPENSSRLSLAVIEGAGPPNEIVEPSSRKRQTNMPNDLPLIRVDTDPEREQSIPVVAIAGAGGGVLVAVGVLTAIVIIIVCVLRKKDKGNTRSTTDRHTMSREDSLMNNTAYIATTSTIPNTLVDTDIYSEPRPTEAEATPTKQEEDALYINTTVGKTIPTEENAAYGGRVLGGSHSQATTTFTAQPDELNEDSAEMEYDYIVMQ